MSGTWAKFVDWVRWGDPLRHRADLLRLLESTRAIMDEHGLTWWLEWGTLLGCIRHGALIPWDYDLDAGMTVDCLDRLRQIAPRIGLPEGVSFTWDESEDYGRFWLGPCWIDLVGYRYRPERRAWQTTLPDSYRNSAEPGERYPDYPENSLFPLRTGRVGAALYPIPCQAEALLRESYGRYRRLDGIPLAVSFAYHPIAMTQFVSRYLRDKCG